MLRLRNPHSVLAALETRPSDVVEVRVGSLKNLSEGWERVAELARKHRIPVNPGSAPSRERRDEQGRQGANEAQVKPREPLSTEELFDSATDRAGGKGLWLALDSLQDPQNVGAIFRTASFFGVQGILLTQERSAPITETAYDVAAGGVEHVPHALQVNLQRAFEVAKEKGLWILGSSEHANDDISTIQTDRPWLLVLGNEEKGMRRLTEESCDVLCRISPRGGTTSLNVSVAAGVLISRLSS